MSSSPQRSKSTGSFCAEHLVVAPCRPPVAVLPHPLVVVVPGVRGIDGGPAVPQLASSSTSQPPGRRHATICRIACSWRPWRWNSIRREQTRSNEPAPERVERVLEDVVLDDLEVRELEPVEVPGVEVGRDHLAGRAHLLGQPHRHRATAGSDLEAPPAGLDQGASSRATSGRRSARGGPAARPPRPPGPRRRAGSQPPARPSPQPNRRAGTRSRLRCSRQAPGCASTTGRAWRGGAASRRAPGSRRRRRRARSHGEPGRGRRRTPRRPGRSTGSP